MTALKEYLLKKSKIVATIGPASQKTETIVSMIRKGMNVARLNCSHGDHQTLTQWINNIREAEKETGVPVPIMLDLQGPKIRIGTMKEGKTVELLNGSPFTITTQELEGDATIVSTTYKELPQVVNEGDAIFINDGLVRLRVQRKTETDIYTTVEIGGIISNHKGINVPGVVFNRRGITHKDLLDLELAKQQDVDYVAVSFVEKAADLIEVRKHLGKDSRILVIAKIERMSAVERLDELLNECEGVMVARGDLGVEITLERVPLTQKDIIRKAIDKKRLTIVATQMLESMTHSTQPTRAEVSDVANSILDNTDGIMLSAETAMGDYPETVVKMMSNIALEIEKHMENGSALQRRRGARVYSTTDAVTSSALEAADALNISKIVVFTETGRSAFSLALRRPRQEILAFSPNLKTRRQLQLVYGVHAVEFPRVSTYEEMISVMERLGAERKFWDKGEMLIVISGPPGLTGGTNLLKVHQIPN